MTKSKVKDIFVARPTRVGADKIQQLSIYTEIAMFGRVSPGAVTSKERSWIH